METRSGHLTVKAVSNLFKTKSYPDSWCVLFSGKGNWPGQINVYPSASDTSPEKCLKIIYLEQVQWMNPNQSGVGGHMFGLIAKGKKFWFVASSDQERQEWIFALCCVNKALFDSKHLLGQSGSLVGHPEQMDDDVVVHSNSLYTSTSEMHSFDVVADSSGDCAQHNIAGHLRLCVDSGIVNLYNTNGRKIVSWPISNFRDYGHAKNRVFFNTGSRSCTGAGSFSFITIEGEKIIDVVSHEAKKLEMLGSHQTAVEPSHVYSNEATSKGNQRGHPESSTSKQFMGASSSHKLPAYGNELTDSGFSEKLNLALSHGGGELAAGHSPVERTASSSSSKVEAKKSKELDKEKKKLEKQRKKEQEKEEKKQKKLAKQEAKNSKNNGKKDSLSEKSESVADSVPDVYNDIDDTYAVADEVAKSKKRAAPAPPPKPAVDTESKIYQDPWENRPLFPSPPVSPAKLKYDDKTEDVYAMPEKKPGGTHPKVMAADTYEDVGGSDAAAKKVPPPVPPKNLAAEDEEEANNNVYDHFSGNKPNDDSAAHIYGMESASAPFTPRVNLYEATGDAYEITEIPSSQTVSGGGIYEPM